MRYSLRTLVILTVLGPPLVAAIAFWPEAFVLFFGPPAVVGSLLFLSHTIAYLMLVRPAKR